MTSRFGRGHAKAFIEIVLITLALMFAAVLSASVGAQSGRLKDPKSKPKPGQGPVVQPRRPPTSQKSPTPILNLARRVKRATMLIQRTSYASHRTWFRSPPPYSTPAVTRSPG